MPPRFAPLRAVPPPKKASAAWWQPLHLARPGIWCALIGFSSLPATASAAHELKVSLEYDVDSVLENCPSEGDFRRSISDQLGYDPFREGAPHRVVAHAEATEHGIEGRLEWRKANGEAEGERHLSSASRDCAEFARGMGFAIVVQIQLLSVSAPSESTPSPAVPARPTSGLGSPPKQASPTRKRPSVPTSGPEPPRVSATRGRWQALVGAGPLVAFGLSPEPSVLGRVFGTLRHYEASLELGAEASLPTTLTQADGTGFRSRVVLATLAPCIHVQRLSGCAVAKVGHIRVHGLGVDEERSPSGLLGQAGVRLAVSQRVGRHLACTLHAEVLGTATRWTVRLNDAGVWTLPVSSFLGGIDVAYSF